MNIRSLNSLLLPGFGVVSSLYESSAGIVSLLLRGVLGFWQVSISMSFGESATTRTTEYGGVAHLVWSLPDSYPSSELHVTLISGNSIWRCNRVRISFEVCRFVAVGVDGAEGGAVGGQG